MPSDETVVWSKAAQIKFLEDKLNASEAAVERAEGERDRSTEALETIRDHLGAGGDPIYGIEDAITEWDKHSSPANGKTPCNWCDDTGTLYTQHVSGNRIQSPCPKCQKGADLGRSAPGAPDA